MIRQQLLLGPFSVKNGLWAGSRVHAKQGSHLCVMESLALMRKPGQPLLDLPVLSKTNKGNPSSGSSSDANLTVLQCGFANPEVLHRTLYPQISRIERRPSVSPSPRLPTE
jgi:hypothetical protein